MRYPIMPRLFPAVLLAVPAALFGQPRPAPVPAILLPAHAAGLADGRLTSDLNTSGFGRAADALPFLGVDLVGARGLARYALEFGVFWQPSRSTGSAGRSQQTGGYTFTASYGRAIGAVGGGALVPTLGLGGTHRYTRLEGGTGNVDRTSWSAYRANPGRESTLHTSTLSADLGLRWSVPGAPGRGGATIVRELRAGYRAPLWGDRPSVDGTDLAQGPRGRTAVWYAGLGIGLGRTP
jgi:hypothetical protein